MMLMQAILYHQLKVEDTIDIASSQTLTTGDSNDKTLSGDISGSGNLTKARDQELKL